MICVLNPISEHGRQYYCRRNQEDTGSDYHHDLLDNAFFACIHLDVYLKARHNFHGFGNSMMRRYVDASRLDDVGLRDSVRGMTTRLGPAVFLRQNALPRLDGRDVLQGYAAPALVLCGANDGITPVQRSREMAAMMPASELVELPDCGHLAPLEQPLAVSAALRRWLLRAG